MNTDDPAEAKANRDAEVAVRPVRQFSNATMSSGFQLPSKNGWSGP